MRPTRHVLVTCAAVVAVGALVGAAALVRDGGRRDDVGLYTAGVGIAPDGSVTTIAPDADLEYLPGTRVIDPGPDADAVDVASAQALAAETLSWIGEGTLPGFGTEYEGLVTDAMLDLHTLLLEDGAAVAGYSSKWRYVWPRDASFIAAALAVSGHVDDAADVLGFLQRVQHEDGTFQARYLPDGSGPPDDRGLQTDGSAWVLWATEYVLGTLPGTAQGRDRGEQLLADLRPMIDRSTDFLLAEVSGPSALPAPSADYWEHRESRLTLGTAAPVLAGLEAATSLYGRLGEAPAAQRTHDGAARLRAAVETSFGTSGYGRYPGRAARDAATAFLLPPFQPVALQGAESAWRASFGPMARPAGGLAPGATWRETSISWTPQTTLYAWAAAANGDGDLARELLDWVGSHRTRLGAIPEKVSPDGSPAGVAPLTWSCALVVLTVAELERG